ncbi:MAG TPA: phosphoribosylformylglycinamidine synthase subunit PurQ [Vicinamibacteria bacterium]|jgi:phosphoribosylformylglycinamidine synthase I|nr:phosphoribosylformylglycinamidine synthase subunit PurQ [Vicinamibacteria bacterium]
MRVGVVVFPGSNCDHDTYYVLKDVCGQEARFVWHKDTDLSGLDAVVLPGGFAYGDYLRTGAIARFSPVMRAVGEFAERGGPVLGVCNGFQILQEAGLLPGAMLRNRGLKFLSLPVHVRVERSDTPMTAGLAEGTVLTMPIAHGEGNFYLPDEELDRLEGEGGVVFRYTTKDGRLEDAANVNGSSRAIAGVCNRARNVVGLMPHPERASEPELGSTDGRRILEALVRALQTV